ncbi:MAG: hypothetical protein AAF927_08400 [Bacteroidota bacterium]
MRNRKLNRGLIPLVILVWAMLAYRFWYEGHPAENDSLPQPLAWQVNSIETGRDSFSLSLPFRDPFLTSQTPENKRSAQQQKAPQKASKLPRLPKITYKGSLKASTHLGLIVWDGKSHAVLPEQSIHNAQIKHIAPEYIDILIEGKNYRIGKGKSIGAG